MEKLVFGSLVLMVLGLGFANYVSEGLKEPAEQLGARTNQLIGQVIYDAKVIK
ncbi:hypothetical protein [Brevibacillus reuszeri]|uniref:hypothetical protein n=1 Tax=Brevibacillus reuszeri TaxID=54915 RepID=UPI0013DF23AB|nr:hypothetical protein [Brevibacillus reuszeri]